MCSQPGHSNGIMQLVGEWFDHNTFAESYNFSSNYGDTNDIGVPLKKAEPIKTLPFNHQTNKTTNLL